MRLLNKVLQLICTVYPKGAKELSTLALIDTDRNSNYGETDKRTVGQTDGRTVTLWGP